MNTAAGVTRRMIVGVLVSAGAFAQAPATCEEMTERFQAFRKQHDFTDLAKPKANPELAERAFGPALVREPHLAGERLVYEVDGCAGRLVFDSKSVLYSVDILTTDRSARPRELVVFERMEAVRARIRKLEGELAAARAEEGKMAAGLPLAPELRTTELKAFAAEPMEGDYLLHSGRNREAAGAYQRAVEQNPGNVGARFRRGIALQRMGEHAEALAEFEAVLRAQPANRDARIRQSLAHLALGRKDEAVQTALGKPAGDVAVAETTVVRGFAAAAPVPQAAPVRAQSFVPAAPVRPVPRAETVTYYRGPRGGCYTIGSGGNKRYVDRSMCN